MGIRQNIRQVACRILSQNARQVINNLKVERAYGLDRVPASVYNPYTGRKSHLPCRGSVWRVGKLAWKYEIDDNGKVKICL